MGPIPWIPTQKLQNKCETVLERDSFSRVRLFPWVLNAPLSNRSQYLDLMLYINPIVNWNELRLVGGMVAGGSLR